MVVPKSSWLSAATAVPCEQRPVWGHGSFPSTSLELLSWLGLLRLSCRASGLQYPLDQPVLTHVILWIQWKKVILHLPWPSVSTKIFWRLPVNRVLQGKAKHALVICSAAAEAAHHSTCCPAPPLCPHLSHCLCKQVLLTQADLQETALAKEKCSVCVRADLQACWDAMYSES